MRSKNFANGTCSDAPPQIVKRKRPPRELRIFENTKRSANIHRLELLRWRSAQVNRDLRKRGPELTDTQMASLNFSKILGTEIKIVGRTSTRFSFSVAGLSAYAISAPWESGT